MPQSTFPADHSPRYRIVTDPPLPSWDGILRADDLEEQRRLKRGKVNRGARFLLRHMPVEIAALVAALAIFSLPFWATLIALDGFWDVLEWDLRLPLWSSYAVLVIWAVAAGLYLAACQLSWSSWLVSLVLAVGFGAAAALCLFIGRIFLIFAPITLLVVGIAIAKGTGLDMLAFLTWFALLIFGPVSVSLIFGGAKF